ncbi:MAG: hypothetical protein ACEY3C_07810, partial [Candidatus Tisiphia sp.]
LDLLFQQKKYDVALIKLFDRIHNLETVGVKSPEKIKKNSRRNYRYIYTSCCPPRNKRCRKQNNSTLYRPY